MTLTDQIKECKAKITDFEFNLAVEKEVLSRLLLVDNGQKKNVKKKSRPVVPHSVVDPIQSVLEEVGKPMKVADLTAAVKSKGFKFKGRTKPKRLVSSALIRRDDLFERVGVGLFDLKAKKEELFEVTM